VSSKALEKKAKDRRAFEVSPQPCTKYGKIMGKCREIPYTVNGKLLGTFSINGGIVSKLSLIIEG